MILLLEIVAMHQYFSSQLINCFHIFLDSFSSDVAAFLGSPNPISEPRKPMLIKTEILCNNKSSIYLCFFHLLLSRYRRKICGLLLPALERAERFRLPTDHRFRHLRGCQVGPEPPLPLRGQMQSNHRCRSQADRQVVLQAPIPERSRL